VLQTFFISFFYTHMKKLSLSKGFTLIELLVVITIIGILATGATAVYSTAQAKARDSNRITDVQVIRTGIEQAYSDVNAYPDPEAATPNTPSEILISKGYLSSGGVTDVKADLAGSGTNSTLNYVYITDLAAGNNQNYEISTGFEADGNVGTSSKSDEGGDDDLRFETGSDILILDTSYASLGTLTDTKGFEF